MNIPSTVENFAKASVELEKLNANRIGAPWYTSVEDYYAKESADLRAAHEEQENHRQTLLAVMASSADALIAMERSIGTGRVMRLAAVNDVDSKVVLELLNY